MQGPSNSHAAAADEASRHQEMADLIRDLERIAIKLEEMVA